MSNGLTMRERKEPVFVEFTKEGTTAVGILTNIDAPMVGGKKVPRFVLAEGEMEDGAFVPNGESVCFLGTASLIQKLKLNDRGRYVSVRFEGTDQNVNKNGNAMKVYKVHISDECPPWAMQGGKKVEFSSLGISDDDIPF